MVRLAPEIRDAAEKYVRLRLTNMRGLDLNVFDFDYDLTWAALLLSPEGRILGRFGGRDAHSPHRYLTLPALRYALEEGVKTHEATRKEKWTAIAPRRPEDYPAAQKLSPRLCIHCHHVHEFQRAAAIEKGNWQPHQEYRYPDAATLGFELDPRQGNRVTEAKNGFGLIAGDVLLKVNDARVRSYADVRTALDGAPNGGSLSVWVVRGSEQRKIALRLEAGWKEKTDISWRWSLKSLRPDPPVAGEDLGAAERKALGLAPDQFALRQGPFLSQAARQAGVRIGDIIVGIDGDAPMLTAREFDVFFRLSFRDRKEATFDIIRGKDRKRIVVKLD